jgi:hypothetical protein
MLLVCPRTWVQEGLTCNKCPPYSATTSDWARRAGRRHSFAGGAAHDLVDHRERPGRDMADAVWGKFAVDSPLEGSGFELPVPAPSCDPICQWAR